MIYLEAPENFNPRFEVASCFCEYGGKFVLLHRQDYKPEGGTWGMPAGKIDFGEPLFDAIIREIKEETHLKTSLESLSYLRQVFVRYPDYDFVYHIFRSTLDREPKVKINLKEHKAFRWVAPAESLSMNLIGGLDECIKLFYQV